MQGKDSFSFGSDQSSSVWHTQQPPIPLNNNSITFNELVQSSRQYLGQSMIKKMPTSSRDDQVADMGRHLQVVCLFQAVEIERLTLNLQEYKIKFKELHNEPLDRKSYEMQVNELHEFCYKFEQENQKLKKYSELQNQEILSLNQRLFQRKNSSDEDQDKFSAMQRQLQNTNQRYEKSMKGLEKMYEDNLQLTDEVFSLKKQIEGNQNRKESFERERILQIQRMRESYEMKIHEQNYQYQSQFTVHNSETIHNYSEFEQTIYKLKSTVNDLSAQLQNSENRFHTLSQQNKTVLKLNEDLQAELEAERSESNKMVNDSGVQIKIFADQVQRLNSILEQKNGEHSEYVKVVKQVSENLRSTTKQLERSKYDYSSLEQKSAEKKKKITDYSLKLSRASERMGELQAKLTYAEEQLIRRNSQIIEKTAIIAEKDDCFQKLQRKVREMIQNKEDLNLNNENQYKAQLEESQKLIHTFKQQIVKLEVDNKVVLESKEELKSHIENLVRQHSGDSGEKDKVIKEYEEKITNYFEMNRQLQGDSEKLLKENKSLIEEKRHILLKVSSLEKTKNAIEKELDKQILSFKDNNHKTRFLLQDNTHAVQLNNYQKQYTSNHSKLLDQIGGISLKLIEKENEKKSLLEEINTLKELTESLKEEIISLKTSVNHGFSSMAQDRERKNSQENQQEHYTVQFLEHLKGKDTVVQNMAVENSKIQEELRMQSQQLQQSESITEKAIQLAKENAQLKDRLQTDSQKVLELAKDKQLLNMQVTSLREQFLIIKEKYIGLEEVNHQKDAIIREMSTANQVFKQRVEEEVANHNPIAQKKGLHSDDENYSQVSQLMSEFKELNSSLLMKINEIERRNEEFQIISHYSGNGQGNPDSHKLIPSHESESQVFFSFNKNPSLVTDNHHDSQGQFIKEAAKQLQNTKLIEENNRSFLGTISQLKEQILQTEQTYQFKIQELELVIKEERSKLKIQYTDRFSLQQENETLSVLSNKLSDRNRALVEENSELYHEFKAKQSQLTHAQNDYSSLQLELENFKTMFNQHNEKFKMAVVTEKGKLENQIQLYKKDLHNREELIQNFTQKYIYRLFRINLLEVEIQKYNCLFQSLKNQNLHLKEVNYDFVIELEKSKVTAGKIEVLNHEIVRLQTENLDLAEEIDICKFQICEDSYVDRKVQQLLAILVLNFAEVESLRSRVKEKDVEIETLRKTNLANVRSYRN